MTDSPPENCARCGDEIRGQPSYWRLRPEWRMYLEENRDLDWYPTSPIVACCYDCRTHLDFLHDSVSEFRAYGTDTEADNAVERIHEELDELDLECIVDQQVV